jgi:uncharacterized protein
VIGVGEDRFMTDSPVLGHLFETFVVNEVLKQLTWNEAAVRPFHWRDRNLGEVDLVLEHNDGRVVGIECKLASDVDPSDFAGLRVLRDRLGERFVAGAVVHLGDRVRDVGDRLTSLPVSAIWQ